MKAYLLFDNQDLDLAAPLPANSDDLIQDLELRTLLDAMALGDKFIFDVSARVLLASLDDPAAIRYRQSVLTDCIAHPEVIRDTYAVAVGALQDRRHLWGYTSSQQPAPVLSGAIGHLEAAVVRLRQLRTIADEHGASFASVGLARFFRTLQVDLDDDYFATISYHLKQLHFRGGELMSARLDWDNSGIDYVLRSAVKVRSAWKGLLGIGPRASYSFNVPPRDEAGGQALSDITNRGVNLVANAAAQSADHISSYFTLLRAELAFYVGCVNLHDQLSGRSVQVAFPEPAAWRPLSLACRDLRDACLALRKDGAVVGNDVNADGTSLLVITGANSGGKSTFLRSVGLAQLMMQCGMFVTAESYRASACRQLFTHFIREEDASMTSGRLDEELSRMSTIADQIEPRSLMLFNESFAATNEREGSEIGRQVVRALLEADIKVLFVTHQFDFAERFHEEHASSTLFLRAQRQADGRRTYKLEVAEPLATSFGEDLYKRLGGWLGEDDQSALDVVRS